MEYKFGHSIIYDTRNYDERGRPILTKISPAGRASRTIKGEIYLPLREAAKQLNFHEQTLREGVWRDTIPSIKIGGRVYLSKKWVADQKLRNEGPAT